jgi:FkbM family methyltransferase
MFKKIIKNSLNFLGYEIIPKEFKDFYTEQNLDKIFRSLFRVRVKKLVIFDVGANRGQSIKRFRKIFSKAYMHCFEPIPRNYRYILKNYKNNMTFINNYALGEKNGIKKFFINENSGTSSFFSINKKSNWAKKNKLNRTIKSENVKMTTLDNYVKKNKIKKIDILKIDVQGFEDKVLNGAKNLLRKNLIKTLEIELNFSDHYSNKLSFYDIEKYLTKNGYELCAIKNTGWHFLDNSTTWFLDCIYKLKNFK